MKSAEDRADYIADLCGVGKNDTRKRDEIRLSFAQHARDQRHQCATAVLDTADDWGVLAAEILNRAHAAVMNARAPGT